MPKDYLRRQTVKIAERFITPELKGFEDKVLGARDRALAREKEIYEELLTQLIDRLGPMQQTAAASRSSMRSRRSPTARASSQLDAPRALRTSRC